jgi:hypothetical protein
MILGLGSDIVDVRRIASVIERHGERFLGRIFTATERAKAERRANSAETYGKTVCRKRSLRQSPRHRPPPGVSGGYGCGQSGGRAAHDGWTGGAPRTAAIDHAATAKPGSMSH